VLHGALEVDLVLELFGDRLCDELCVELGALDLVDVDVHVLVCHVVDFFVECVYFGIGFFDDDSRLSGVDVDCDPLLVFVD